MECFEGGKRLSRRGINQFRAWSEEDTKLLKEYYTITPDEIFNIQSIAQKLNRSEDSITIKARKFGLTNKNRKASCETRKKLSVSQKIVTNLPNRRLQMSQIAKQYIQQNGHPKGMKDHKHSMETKLKIGKSTKERWKDKDNYLNSKEYRQHLSDMFLKLAHSRGIGNTHTRCNGGKREDLNNQYFRSAWEANIARYLNFLKESGDIEKWEYEAETFWFTAIKRGTRSYTPDFKIWERDKEPYFIEVKGWMNKQSRTRLERMKKYFPHIKIELLDEDRYRTLRKQLKGLIKGWE